jgi:hypothetical protein
MKKDVRCDLLVIGDYIPFGVSFPRPENLSRLVKFTLVLALACRAGLSVRSTTRLEDAGSSTI